MTKKEQIKQILADLSPTEANRLLEKIGMEIRQKNSIKMNAEQMKFGKQIKVDGDRFDLQIMK